MSNEHLSQGSSTEQSTIDEGAAEFEATREERAAITEVERTTYDVIAAFHTAGKSLAKILPLADELVKHAFVERSIFDKITVYARAAVYSIKLERSNGPDKDTAHAADVAEMEALYQRLYRTAEYLVGMGDMDARILTAARTGTSVSARAVDLGTLSLELREFSKKHENTTRSSTAEIARAATLSQQVLDSLVRRATAESATNQFTTERQRAAMLFVRAWEEIRRGVHWVRWHEGDAAEIAPSFYAGTDRRPRKDNDGTSNNPSTPNNPSKPVEPADPLPADKREELARGGVANPAKPLVPQDDPFVR
jgi:hypothetical protein